jgi:hypothetical protein
MFGSVLKDIKKHRWVKKCNGPHDSPNTADFIYRGSGGKQEKIPCSVFFTLNQFFPGHGNLFALYLHYYES